MNIFLTGNVQVGKSTAIKKFLEKENIKPLGFTTHLDRDTGSLMMKVSVNDGEYDFQVAAPGKSHRPVPDTDAFDRAGRLLMDIDTQRCKLLIMDELGFLEKDASVFSPGAPRPRGKHRRRTQKQTGGPFLGYASRPQGYSHPHSG